jgi:hypothetical protein
MPRADSHPVEVGALVLDQQAYARVIRELSGSTYAHFREASVNGADQEEQIRRLRAARAKPYNNEYYERWSDADLTSESLLLAAELLGPGKRLSESRRLVRLRLELFARSPLGARLAESPVDSA